MKTEDSLAMRPLTDAARRDRARGMVIWVLGLSGAGKTTLCNAVSDLLRPFASGVVRLDGDQVRKVFQARDYSEAGRIEQFGRVQRLATLLSTEGVTVLVSGVYSNAQLLAVNRSLFPRYVEVYLRAPLDFVQARDSNGLYASRRRGETRDVVGVDIPFYPPEAPHVAIDAVPVSPPHELAARVLNTALAIDEGPASGDTNDASWT